MNYRLYSINMDVTEICKKIFSIAEPYAQNNDSPISYINIEFGFNVGISEEELWSTFNKIRWDTILSSAELFIIRKPFIGIIDNSIKVTSVALFEDEEGFMPKISIKNGLLT